MPLNLLLFQMNRMGLFKTIRNVSIHEFYNGHTGDYYDIALIELTSKFQWSFSVKPVCLPSTDYKGNFPNPLMVSGENPGKKDRT